MKTLGEVIAVVEALNGASCGAKIRLNRIASDRWAVVLERNGALKTLSTGIDVLEAYKKIF
ncbi:hypothetical protein BV57P3_00038 [Phocaeicola phage BV57P3]|nr:hypothetical protein BV57P3_00038 [Phocaeicola phage BV57P3]